MTLASPNARGQEPVATLNNPRHESFAQALARGLTATEAYAEAGYKGDRTAASRLSTNVNIRKRVAEIVSRVSAKAEWSAADRLKTLSEIVDRTALTDPRVAVSAISEANKMQGSHAPTKNEHSDPGGWSQAEDKTWRQVLRSETS